MSKVSGFQSLPLLWRKAKEMNLIPGWSDKDVETFRDRLLAEVKFGCMTCKQKGGPTIQSKKCRDCLMPEKAEKVNQES